MPPVNRLLVIESKHQIEDELRSQVLEEIKRRGIGPEQLSHELGMLRPSAELLLERKTWPLELGLRIAKGLDMKVRIRASATD